MRARLGAVLVFDSGFRRPRFSLLECLFSAGAEQRRRGEECELPYSTGYFREKQILPSGRHNRLEKSTIRECKEKLNLKRGEPVQRAADDEDGEWAR